MSKPAAEEPLHYDDALLRRILTNTKTIAMVGASPDWVRPSNFAMKYLQGKGYRVIPVRLSSNWRPPSPPRAPASSPPGKSFSTARSRTA